MRTLASLPTLLAVALAVACGGDKPSNTGKDADKAAAQESSATPDKAAESSDGKAAESAGKEAGDSSATPSSDSNAEAADSAAAGSGGDPSEAPATGGGDEAAPTGGESGEAAESGEAGGEAGDAAGDEKSEEDKKKEEIAKLLKSVRSKRTSDTKADKALAEAEGLGAEVRELAEAANDRGDALLGEEGDRATKYFEWARDKDTSYPDPSFNLAKMTVLSGDVPGTIAHLEEVKKRGGKKLLKTVGYDPLFEVVKDDKKVQALIR